MSTVTDEKRAENEARHSARKRELLAVVDTLDKGGWCPIPVPAKAKAPIAKGWNKMRMTRDDAAGQYGNDGNVGNRNGAPSGWRTDLDLDWPECVAVADVLLATLPAHGRASNPRSHRWSLVADSESVEFLLPASCKDDPRFGGEHAMMIAEIRSTGSQTIMPGSIHESGERVEWTSGALPAVMPTIEADKHRKICAVIALAALTARCNPGQGSRNDTLLAFIGAAARIVPHDGMIDRAVEVICKKWGYSETRPHAKTTIDKIVAGEECVGLPRLCELLGLPEDVAKHINAKWLAPNDKRPRVILGFSLTKTLDDTDSALMTAGVPIFRRGAQLVHVYHLGKDDAPDAPLRRKAGTLGIYEVSNLRFVQYLDERVAFYKQTANGLKPFPAGTLGSIAAHIMARPEAWPYRALTGIIECPTIRSDGTLLVEQGYDVQTGLLLDSGDLVVPPILENPTRDDSIKAMAVITDLFSEFPFVCDDGLTPVGQCGVKCPSRSVAVSGVLTGMARHLMKRAPVHGNSANSIATGKSTLGDLTSVAVTGREAPAMTLPTDEVEAQKAFLAVLLTGSPIIHIDNVDRGTPVGGGVLAKIITQDQFEARILGTNDNAIVSTAVTWLINGNGLTFAADMASRAIRCELDAGMENPQARKFKRDIITYVKEHRGEIVAALLTILRAHAVAGWPMPDKFTPSRFPEWDRIVRGAIVWCGEPDPYDTADSIDADDPEKNDVRTLHDALVATFSDKEFTSKDIVAAIGKGNEALRGALSGKDQVLNGKQVTARLKADDKVIVGKRRLRRRLDGSKVVHFRVEVLP